MASIREKVGAGGKVSYHAQVRLRGYAPQTATFERKTDARKWAQDTEVAIRSGRYFVSREAERHTLSQLVDRYCEETLPRKPKTAIFQKRQLNWWKNQLGALRLSEVTPSVIVGCREKLRKAGLSGRPCSPSTVNRYLSALSHAFSIACREWEWIEDSPMKRVSKFKEPRGRVRFLSDDERKRLLKACEQTNWLLYLAVVLALSTGMRRGEIMNLRWGDVDLQAGQITLHDTKNGERRAVPLTGLAEQLLFGYAQRAGDVQEADLLFPGHRRAGRGEQRKPVDFRQPWEQALEAAQIKDFRFHDLRHSAASYLAMNGASMTDIAEVLGHKTLQMVKRYSHLSEAHTKQVVASMNEKIFASE